MQQDDQRPVAGLDVMQLHVADLGVALAKVGAGVRRRAGEGIGCRGGHDNLLSRDLVVRATRSCASRLHVAPVKCPGLHPRARWGHLPNAGARAASGEFGLFAPAGASPVTFTQIARQVDDIDATVHELAVPRGRLRAIRPARTQNGRRDRRDRRRLSKQGHRRAHGLLSQQQRKHAGDPPSRFALPRRAAADELSGQLKSSQRKRERAVPMCRPESGGGLALPGVAGALHRGAPDTRADLLAQRSEGRAKLFAEELGLLPGREVAASVEPVVVDEVVRIRALGPAPRRLIELVGEHADGERDRDVLGVEEVRLVLPIQASRRDPGVRQPVERDVVEEVIAREVALQSAT